MVVKSVVSIVVVLVVVILILGFTGKEFRGISFNSLFNFASSAKRGLEGFERMVGLKTVTKPIIKGDVNGDNIDAKEIKGDINGSEIKAERIEGDVLGGSGIAAKRNRPYEPVI